MRFKSYLLSLGIADPVTRETHGSGNKYYRELAKQVSSSLEQPLQVGTCSIAHLGVNHLRNSDDLAVHQNSFLSKLNRQHGCKFSDFGLISDFFYINTSENNF